MPVVFGESVSSVAEIVRALRLHGDRVRGIYRARYAFDERSRDPYSGTTLERPESLKDNPPAAVYPWEHIFLAAAACAGSDYPMLAAHEGVALERLEFVVLATIVELVAFATEYISGTRRSLKPADPPGPLLLRAGPPAVRGTLHIYQSDANELRPLSEMASRRS